MGGALQWHFAGMWLLVLNGLVYFAYNFATGRFRMKLLPVTLTGCWAISATRYASSSPMTT